MVRGYGRFAISRRVLVNMKDGSAIEGVLWEDRRPFLVLRNARLHTHGQSSPLDGEVIIDYAQISFLQAPDPREL